MSTKSWLWLKTRLASEPFLKNLKKWKASLYHHIQQVTMVKSQLKKCVNCKTISGVLFLHDNTRHHNAKPTHKKMICGSMESLLNPFYFGETAPLNYYIFRFLQGFLTGKGTSIVKEDLLLVFCYETQRILNPRFDRIVIKNEENYSISYWALNINQFCQNKKGDWICLSSVCVCVCVCIYIYI